MPQLRPVASGIALALAVLVAVPLAVLALTTGQRGAQEEAARIFARAWETGTLDTLDYAGATGEEVAAQMAAITADLTPYGRDLPRSVVVEEVGPAARGGVIPARLRVRWALPSTSAWTYTTTAPLVAHRGGWHVRWSPDVVHPGLVEGDRLRVRHLFARRAPILGARNEVLVTQRPVVHVGFRASRSFAERITARRVAGIVGVDAGALADRVAAAADGEVVPVTTLRADEAEPLRARLSRIDAVVLTEDEEPLAPTRDFARALLGTVGTATQDIVDESGGRLVLGDPSGLSGVQAAYNERLGGRPGVVVEAVDSANKVRTLTRREGSPGAAVHLTIDASVQVAADAALRGASGPAALVAIRASTGEVLAVANGGPGGSGFDRAMLGHYAPGSTFKVVSTMALLEAGLSPVQPVACPPAVTVAGSVFTNAENETLGTVPFHVDFAHSCNTAFVALASRITGDQLRRTATELGFGADNTLGLPAQLGIVPVATEPGEHAAHVIGQGRVLASPVTVAAASAAVAAGRFMPPRLVVDPVPPASTTPGPALPPAPLAALRSMMREAVTDGTGRALRGVPGGPVHGKTGTAEFGAGNPPATNGWFTGYQGDIAFAVVVENGGFGASSAAPLAAAFLRGLRG